MVRKRRSNIGGASSKANTELVEASKVSWLTRNSVLSERLLPKSVIPEREAGEP